MVYTEILRLTVPYTGARVSSPLSRVCCTILERIFWNAVQKGYWILEQSVYFGIYLDRFDRLRHARVVSI